MEYQELRQWSPIAEALTFPAYRPLISRLSEDPSLLCLMAQQGDETIGMGLAKMMGDRTELLSLFIRLRFRSQHAGTSLLLEMENHLRLKNCKTIFTRYNSAVPGRLPLETIFATHEWSRPDIIMHLFRSNRELLQKIETLPDARPYRNPILARGYSLVPWCDLSPAQLHAIREDHNQPMGWQDKDSPFRDTERIEPLNSFCIFRDKRACGWFINHRIKPDTIRYTLAWLSGRVSGRRGIIVQTFIHCLWRQFLHGPEFLSFGIYKDNQAMLQMVEKRMAERGLILSRTQTYHTEKRISQ